MLILHAIIYTIKTQLYIYSFVCSELIEETGGYPKLIHGNFRNSSTRFGLYFSLSNDVILTLSEVKIHRIANNLHAVRDKNLKV